MFGVVIYDYFLRGFLYEYYKLQYKLFCLTVYIVDEIFPFEFLSLYVLTLQCA